MLTEAIAGMTDEQKRVVTEMGFGGLLKLTLKTIPAAFVRYVVGLLDTDEMVFDTPKWIEAIAGMTDEQKRVLLDEMVLDTPKGKIPIDRMAIHEVLGFPLGNRRSASNRPVIAQWKRKDLLRCIEAENSSGAYGSDDEDVTEVEDGDETTKEDDVNPSFLDKSEAGITHSMTLLDGTILAQKLTINDKAEAPFDEPEAPPFDEPEHNTPSDEAKTPDDASNDSDEANDEPRPNPQDGASKAEPRMSSREKRKTTVPMLLLCCLFLLEGRIVAVVSDGYMRSCPSGLGGLGGFRGTRSFNRVAGARRIRVGSWNVGSLTSKLFELGDALGRHKVDIACFQETKWKGSRASEGNGYKLWRSDRIMEISIVIDGEAVNVINAYAPQVGLSDAEKKRFWDALDELVRECPTDERLIIGGDLNGHIEAATDGYAGVHGGFGFGDRNEEGRTILEFATAHEMVVANSFFRKNEAYLITFQSRGHNTQIDYFLVRRGDLRACKDCRAFPGETCSSRHKLVIVDVLFERKQHRREREATRRPRILWKNLIREAVETFRANVSEKLLEGDMYAHNADQMWNTFAGVIREVAKDSLGVASEVARTHSTHRESWWFCEEVQTKVVAKQSRFKELFSCRDGNQEDIDLAKERYKVPKREPKIAVARAKDRAYEDLYKKLDSKEGANDIYKIAKARERKRRDIGKDGDNLSPLFSMSLLIESRPERSGEVGSSGHQMNYDVYDSRINQGEVRAALQRMGRNKAVGPDQIPIEAWRCLEDEGVKWLTCLFNKIFLSTKMPDEWRLSEVILIYKNKGDAQACSNYRDDIVLIAESAEELNNKIERWREALEDNCKQREDEIPWMRIDEDVAHRIGVGWMKWRAASRVMCDRRIPLKLKGKFYRVAIRPVWLRECWLIIKALANRVEVAELRMLRWTCVKTMVDMIPNGVFRGGLDVDSIIDKMREGRLRWFGHVKRRPQNAPVRKVEAMLVEGSRRRDRPKLRWEDRLTQDMMELFLSVDMTSDRNAWRDRIRISGWGLLRGSILSSLVYLSAPVSAPAPTPAPSMADEIDLEFIAALPPDIQAEVLAQQRAQRVAHQAKGQPVDMDNASIIATTFPADLREECFQHSHLLYLRKHKCLEIELWPMSRRLFGNSHRQTVIDRGVGVTIGRRTSSALLESLKVKEVDGDPLLDPDASKPLMLTTEISTSTGKALFDGQLLDVYFTRSFYKHILGVKVKYHDIEAVDSGYYKNLKWLLEVSMFNDVIDTFIILLWFSNTTVSLYIRMMLATYWTTFSMDADEEKQILYEKSEVTDHELKPGGRNTRVTEETKHEYVDLVAEHILTNAIRPQINSFLEGFNELIPRDLISIFNDKELELLISGLPEIDLDDLKVNTEYTGYTVGTNVVIWFWEVVKAFNKEDRARLLQFVTGTSKVPLEGFKALQGISGPQRFQIHKAYGAPERLPSAHTCFNQLDLPEYTSKEQLQERLLLAIHEANEGFGFG
ncbi:retrovirus-related pol polyprotein LINE-1 [Tanacetum coccineum]